jgi:hypothetical protein
MTAATISPAGTTAVPAPVKAHAGIMFLTGASNDNVELAALARDNLGVLAQPGNKLHATAGAFPLWAADNGCFSKGDAFDGPAYLAYLDSCAATPEAARCIFATAPDVVGDHVATVRRSLPYLQAIRDRGLPVAFVAQDGMEHDTRVRWDLFDVLFIGGSTEWKLGPAVRQLVAEAKRRGKWVHMGRVNSRKRLRYAESIGCDSADGTYLAFGPTRNLPTLTGWLDELAAERGVIVHDDSTEGVTV